MKKGRKTRVKETVFRDESTGRRKEKGMHNKKVSEVKKEGYRVES